MNVLGLLIGIIIHLSLGGKLMGCIAEEIESLLGVIWFAIFGGAAWFCGLAILMGLSKAIA